MDIKKTKAADLENKRLTAFLLGLVCVLALAFVALEYNSNVESDNSSAVDFDDLMEEMEMMPINQEEEIVALEEPDASPANADELKVVDTDVELSLPEESASAESSGDADAADSEDADDMSNDADVLIANPLHFRVVEDLPQFPGGASELVKWLTKTLRYPAKAQKANIEGKVVVQFIVEKDGSISDIQIVKSADPLLDKEAMRVMKKMPAWKPGIQNDQPCRTMVSIPIIFHL